MIQQKVEIRFIKSEAVRFISHHDLMRAFHRALRRAGLPVRLTEGFNPRPRIIFPSALELGVASHDEATEIELTQWIPISRLKKNLQKSLPPGLKVQTVREVARVRKGGQPNRVLYQLHLSEQPEIKATRDQLALLLEKDQLLFLRQKKKGKKKMLPPKEVNLRPYLACALLDDRGDLFLKIRISPEGSAKPLEMLSLLTGKKKDQLLGVRVTKLRMTLRRPPESREEPRSLPGEDPNLSR